MPSTYDIFAQAMEEHRRVVCSYHGLPRELCPVVLGRSDGREKVLAFQVGGRSSRPLTPKTGWRCMFLDQVSGAALKDGPWQAGDSHQTEQRCVRDVDLDVNPDSPFSPRRRLSWQR